jgi:hypothetical protein
MGPLHPPVAATVPEDLRCYASINWIEGVERLLTQRAVAIPALGWRLRAEPRLTCRFGSTTESGQSLGPFGQSPLPVFARLTASS